MPFASDPDLKLVFDTALDAVIVMRSDGTLAAWNAQAERIFGWSPIEVIGKQMSDLIIPKQYRSAHHKGLSHYLATGEGPLLRSRVEITALRKNGDEFPVELSITPFNQGEEVLFFGFARDISTRVRADAAKVRRAREAELLYRVTSMAADTSSLDEALQLCLSSVCELLQWPIGHALLPATKGYALLVSSIWVGDISNFPKLQKATEAIPFTFNVGLPGRIWANREPIWLSDIRTADWFIRGTEADLGISAAFGFPIITAGEVVAVLEFFNIVRTDIDPELLLTARSMGDQIGRVLERQRVQARQKLLLHELDHRAKNMLAVVMAIATQTAKDAPSVDHFTREFLGRLRSLSQSYGLVTAANWEPTTLSALAQAVIGPHQPKDENRFSIVGGDIVFPPKMALGIGMILHELTTNAAKYGALQAGGKILLAADHDVSSPIPIVHLTWKESGVSGVKVPSSRGFGSKLIETTTSDLKGQVNITYGPEGIRYEFKFPKSSDDNSVEDAATIF
jgi:PAS domain S-box-containing protein